jgi:hypothetical protein
MQDELYDIIESFKYSLKKKDWEGISDALSELKELYNENFDEALDENDNSDGEDWENFF